MLGSTRKSSSIAANKKTTIMGIMGSNPVGRTNHIFINYFNVLYIFSIPISIPKCYPTAVAGQIEIRARAGSTSVHRALVLEPRDWFSPF